MSDPYYKLLAGWAAGVEYGNWVSNSANPLTGFATSASVVTSETVLGPVDVGSQSYLLLDATGGSLHSAHESIAINSGQQYSFTSYAQKHASYAGEVAVQYWEAGPKFVGFNINSGSVLFNTGTGTPYYKNRGGGWGRFGVTWTPASIGAAQDIGIATIGSGQNITYTQAGGDPRGAYFAGPKLEAGPVSDYRATTGTPENGSLSVVQSLGQVADEDVYIMRVKRQTADILRRLTVGDATLTIDSTRGQYVQSMQINQGVVVKAVTTANSEYALFTGKVKSWNATPALGRQELSVKCIDAADELKQKINLALAVNTKISSLMINVLDAAGFGSDRRDIGVMNDDVSVGYLDNISAGQALHEIIQSGAHFLWIDGDGKVRAEPRHYDVRGAAAVESMSTFLSYGASYSDKKIINRMNVVGSPRREATDIGTVAWIEEAILIPASQSVTFQVEHVDPDTLAKGTPVNSFATLVASSDYYMSAQSGFKGANLTAQASLTITHYATTTEVTALNTSSFSAYLGRFQLRGLPLQLLLPFK